jgi:hypothetical protein
MKKREGKLVRFSMLPLSRLEAIDCFPIWGNLSLLLNLGQPFASLKK